MAFVLEDRVIETANNPGQGDFELLGAVENSWTFVTGIGDGNTTRYLAVGAEGAEIGVAQVQAGSPDRLLRPGTVKNFDGTTTPVNFSGTVTVACVASVEDVLWLNENGDLPARGGRDLGTDGDRWRALFLTGIAQLGRVTADANSSHYRSEGSILDLDPLGDGEFSTVRIFRNAPTGGNYRVLFHDGTTAYWLSLEKAGVLAKIFGNPNAASVDLPRTVGTTGRLSYGGTTMLDWNHEVVRARGLGSGLAPIKVTQVEASSLATNFPIGHSLLVHLESGAPPHRNSAVTIYIDDQVSYRYLLSGSGAPLSGGWVTRGGSFSNVVLCERVS